MKQLNYLTSTVAVTLLTASIATAATTEGPIVVEKQAGPGRERPILVHLSGFTGEAVPVIEFDLYVQGFAVADEQAAQYLITGSNNGNLQGRVTDRVNKNPLVSKAYSGATIRRQAHAFIDDFVQALSR